MAELNNNELNAQQLFELMDKESWGLVPISVPTGGDDYEIVWNVIEYHQAEPHERLIGVGSESEGPMGALRDAYLNADSYRNPEATS